jgi:exopolyphosphatase/guanosine-5'-triphosphate,3'-diphosphate pyrophosphatase
VKTIGVIDIGTNSVRLAVERIDARNHDSTTLALAKEVVRLGEGEFSHNKITPAAMERGIVVLKKFAEIADRYNVSEVIAIATAAVREALNKNEFVQRAKDEAGIDVKVVSGLEEARLIYLGVVSGVDLNCDRAMFVDIGGGTTELIVGDAKDYSLLDSVKLGAVRLADMFLTDRTGPISKKRYRKIVEYAQSASIHAARKICDLGFDCAYGSSGTIMNLAEITAKRVDPGVTSIRNYEMKYSDLAETASILCNLDLEGRRNIPGINPDRADIIVSGAAILDAVMTAAGAQSIRVSDRALRDGVVIDHIFQEDHIREEYLSHSTRQRSILQLGRSCQFDEGHGKNVSRLARSIFDQLKTLGVHDYGAGEQELLRYAAFIHDVGTFISYSDHHKHSYYVTRNWNLLGFDDEEIEIVATIALCHRKLHPEKVRPQRLNAQRRKLVTALAAILRIADALDRSQLGLIREVVLTLESGEKRLVVELDASDDCPMELWAFESKRSLFQEAFGLDLVSRRFPV